MSAMNTIRARRPFACTLQLSCSALVALMVLSACGNDSQQTSTIPSDFSVTLERGLCFGTCPVYKVSLDASGLVQYDGSRCVRVYGHQELRVSHQHLEELQAAFLDVDFFALQDLYRGNDSSCAPGVFDGTVVTTTLRANGMTKTVRDYHGCNPYDIAAMLYAFEQKVDDLLGTRQWVPCGDTPSYGDYSQCYPTPGCS